MNMRSMKSRIQTLLRECGEIMLTAADIDNAVHWKEGKGNIVTEYDSRVQAVLKKGLAQILPEAAFVGEEDGADQEDISAGYAFIVDPIDGTANFARGLQASCISVALLKDGQPVFGMIYNPYLKECFWAIKGEGAYLNDKPIHVSDRPMEKALILFGSSPYYPELARQTLVCLQRYLEQAMDIRRVGSAALDLCSIACGRGELFFEMRLSPWDFAAGALLVEEAGGVVTGLKGEPILYDRKHAIVARAPHMPLLFGEV